jgi:uncharacterized protein (DUF305 family)
MSRWLSRLAGAVPPALVAIAAAAPGPAHGQLPHTEADVRFMAGMIPHHAQAVLMAGWAPSHGASEAVQRLCERIVVAQRDEIAFMRQWLQDRGQPVPETEASHAHGGPLMPGMLTPEQLDELDRARGVDFDRLFLRYMIHHHEGALTMVDALFASQGAAQDEDVFKFAVDVHADQSTEIDRMRLMLEAQSSGGRNP